jgi:hypothetical protein
MTLDELRNSLPNGLHDARLKTVSVDYTKQEARLALDIWVGDLDSEIESEREAYKEAEVTLNGLLFWVSEPPQADHPYQKARSVKIDAGSVATLAEPPKTKLPAVPADISVNWIYVNDWNACIYVAAKSAQLKWF